MEPQSKFPELRQHKPGKHWCGRYTIENLTRTFIRSLLAPTERHSQSCVSQHWLNGDLSKPVAAQTKKSSRDQH